MRRILGFGGFSRSHRLGQNVVMLLYLRCNHRSLTRSGGAHEAAPALGGYCTGAYSSPYAVTHACRGGLKVIAITMAPRAIANEPAYSHV